MTKYIVLAVALLVGGCESEAPESATDVDAGAVGSSDCGAEAHADAMVDAGSSADASSVLVYDVNFSRLSDGEPGSCGFDLDWFANRLVLDGDHGSWTAEINGETENAHAYFAVTRYPGGFSASLAHTPTVGVGIEFPFGPCVATLSADGSWSCTMERWWIDPDGSTRCFNRYAVTGVPL